MDIRAKKSNRMIKRELIKKISYILLSMVFSLIIFFCLSATAYSQSKGEGMCADRAGMELQEKEFLAGIRQVMEEYGCEHSGITMTKIYGEDGSRNYEIAIHHYNLRYLNKADMDLLEADLAKTLGEWEDVTFCYKFTSAF